MLNLSNVLNFNIIWPWPVKNSSVAHRLRHPGVNDQPSVAAFRRIKTNKEENRMPGSLCTVYVKKVEKLRVMMRKMTTTTKSKTHIINNDKQHSFQFVSVWLFLISEISTKHDLFSFQIHAIKFEGRKGGTFMVGPGRHSASLRHCMCATSIGSIVVYPKPEGWLWNLMLLSFACCFKCRGCSSKQRTGELCIQMFLFLPNVSHLYN